MKQQKLYYATAVYNAAPCYAEALGCYMMDGWVYVYVCVCVYVSIWCNIFPFLQQ
jgi:hypothetical protein